MPDDPDEQKPAAPAPNRVAGEGRDPKAERLAEALRANLKRRKAADRARAGRAQTSASDDEN